MKKKRLILMWDGTDDIWFSFKKHPESEAEWLDTVLFDGYPFVLKQVGCFTNIGTVKNSEGQTEVL